MRLLVEFLRYLPCKFIQNHTVWRQKGTADATQLTLIDSKNANRLSAFVRFANPVASVPTIVIIAKILDLGLTHLNFSQRLFNN